MPNIAELFLLVLRQVSPQNKLKFSLFCCGRKNGLPICSFPTVRTVFKQLWAKLNKQLLTKNALIELNNGKDRVTYNVCSI